MMTKRNYWAGLLLTAACLPATAFAQKDSTLNRTVVVENQYNPLLQEATKLNLYPAVEEPKAANRSFDYARSLRPVADWGQNEMPLLQRLTADELAPRGYLRLGYGLRGRADVAAGYTWDLTDNDRLSAAFALDGWDGKRSLGDDSWTSRLYRTQAGADYRHRFQQYDLTLGAEWRNTVFNYIPLTPAYQHQRFTEGDIHAGLRTTDRTLPLQFSLQTGYRSFLVAHPSRVTEKQIHTLGQLWAPINEEQRVGVDFGMDNTFYSAKSSAGTDETAIRPDSYTSLQLNPYFAYENEDWRLRLGVHVDPLLGGPDKGVDVAPDVRLERLFNGNSVLYLHALGGRELNDFRRLSAVTPYAGIPSQAIPTYVQLNATLGFKMSPLPGWWLHVYGGYQVRNDELFASLTDDAPYVYAAFEQAKGKLTFGGAEVKYAYKDVLDITAKANAYGWKTDAATDEAEEALLRFKPRYDWNLQAEGKVYEGIRIQAGFEYVDRRQSGDKSVQNLYTGASVTPVRNVTIFARVNNLLNKQYVGTDFYPAEKLGFIAGVKWLF
jgi:hypothetical protein